nr:reverse transcriptase domain-containing protein [Tanacetum cinerariifolium]
TTNLKNDITNFQQRFDETFSDAWDRFKDLLHKCPHHCFSELHQIDTFYNELTQSDQNSINAAAGRNLLNRTPRDALKIIENKSKIVKELVLMNKATQQATVKTIEDTCVTCGGPNPYYGCLATDGNTFDACAAVRPYNQGGNGYRPQGDSNYYDRNQMGPPGFHPLNVQNNQNYNQNQYNQNQGFNQQKGQNFNQGNNNYQAPLNQAQVGPSNDFSNYMKTNDVNMRAMQNQISNMKTKLKNGFQTTMKNQNNELKYMMSNELKNMMSSFIQMQSPSGSGSLPSNIVANLRGDVKAITTRSGVSYDGPMIPPTSSTPLKEVKRELEVRKDKDQKLREKANNQMLKFLQIFQRLHFDISFTNALLHMPKFASTFKSLLSNKENLFQLANTPLNENCSAVLLKKLPKNLGDPGKFLIPGDFPELEECLALADLGARINLMPLSVWNKLSLPEHTPTRMTLELANRSVAYPVSVAEDVFMKVGKFYFLADFVVVDYDVDPWVPLILGRPFLRMARGLIDVHGEELNLRVNDEAITFKVEHTSRYSRNYYDESVNQINVIDVACEEYAQEVFGFLDSLMSGNPTPSDPIIASSSPSFTPFEGGYFILEEMETFLRTPNEFSNLDNDYYDTEGDILYLEKLLNEDPSSNLPPMKNEDLKQDDVTMIKPSIKEPPELELKDLPSYLEYAFLEGTDKLPVIISKELKDEEKTVLLKILKSHKRAIAWKISNIKGIDPPFLYSQDLNRG